MAHSSGKYMAELALNRDVDVLPSLNNNPVLPKVERTRASGQDLKGSPTKDLSPSKGSPKKGKMIRFTGNRGVPHPSPTRSLKPINANDKIAAAKRSNRRVLDRADHLKTYAQSKKELSLLFQHKVIWEQEYMHLKYLEDRLQREIYNHLTIFGQLNLDPDVYLADNVNFILEIEEERAFFRENVVDPLWFIREDINEWLSQHDIRRPLGEVARIQHSQIQEEVKVLWTGYKEMVLDLLQEQHDIEAEVKEARAHVVDDRSVTKGVPPEFYELYCPDPQLKENLIVELNRIDDNYSNRLKDLEKACDRQACPGGWNENDSITFQHILDQYPADLPDRRVLCFDRLKRTFPAKTLGQLMSYETWFQNHRFHRDRRNKCLEDWIRERWSWLLRAVAEVSQSQQAYEAHQLSRAETIRQRAHCELLRQRVEQWRKEKENERLQQSELDAQRKLALKVVQQRKAAKEEYRREIARQRLRSYYDDRLRFQRDNEEAIQQRLEDMKQISKERSKYDRERVRYRTELFYANQKDRRERMLKLREEQRLRQQRLENLRKQVPISVDRDPERVHQDTIASQTRKETSTDGLALQALHELRTILDNQVHRDPRVRLEQQLREAGLLNSEYARHILQQLHPLREPRKDTFSSFTFKDLEN